MVAPTASFLATGKIQRTREGSASRAAADALVKSQQGCGWDGGSSDHHGTLWDIAKHSVFRGPDKFLWKRVTMEPCMIANRCAQPATWAGTRIPVISLDAQKGSKVVLLRTNLSCGCGCGSQGTPSRTVRFPLAFGFRVQTSKRSTGA